MQEHSFAARECRCKGSHHMLNKLENTRADDRGGGGGERKRNENWSQASSAGGCPSREESGGQSGKQDRGERAMHAATSARTSTLSPPSSPLTRPAGQRQSEVGSKRLLPSPLSAEPIRAKHTRPQQGRRLELVQGTHGRGWLPSSLRATRNSRAAGWRHTWAALCGGRQPRESVRSSD